MLCTVAGFLYVLVSGFSYFLEYNVYWRIEHTSSARSDLLLVVQLCCSSLNWTSILFSQRPILGETQAFRTFLRCLHPPILGSSVGQHIFIAVVVACWPFLVVKERSLVGHKENVIAFLEEKKHSIYLRDNPTVIYVLSTHDLGKFLTSLHFLTSVVTFDSKCPGCETLVNAFFHQNTCLIMSPMKLPSWPR